MDPQTQPCEMKDRPEPKRSPPPNDATGHMSVMGKDGDTKFYWNAKDPEQVAAAKEIFDAHRGKGYCAFHMSSKGDQGEQMGEFDPDAGSILFIPQMQGG